jgi:hypothetical protein
MGLPIRLALHDALRYVLPASHPLGSDFVLELPEELQAHFKPWGAEAGFIPAP